MKNFITIVLITLSLSAFSQASTYVQELTDQNRIAVDISDDPATGLKRFVEVTNERSYFAEKYIRGRYTVYSYNDSVIVERLTYEEPFKVNNSKQIEVASSDSSTVTVGEYDYLFGLINSNEVNYFELFRLKALELDALGRFNK